LQFLSLHSVPFPNVSFLGFSPNEPALESAFQRLVGTDLFRWLELPVDAEFVARAFEACQQALEARQIDQLFVGGVSIRSFDSLNIPNPESPEEEPSTAGSKICRVATLKPSIQDLFDGVNWRVRARLNKMRAILEITALHRRFRLERVPASRRIAGAER
jgi:hypothetical protein